jgi:transposase-like protein
MSVLDQLRDLEREVVGRLRELEPLVREYEQLRAAAERLGVKYNPGSGADEGHQPAPGRRRRAARATPRSTAGGRPSSGQHTSASGSGDRAGRAVKRPSRSVKATGTATSRRAGRRRAPAAPGERHEQILGLVTERPGITVAQIAQRLGIDATGLYRVVRQLTETGQVRKDGPQLYPSNQARTRAQTANTTGSESRADSKTAAVSR